MPILAHTVFRDDPLAHIAWVDYRPPCIEESRRTRANLSRTRSVL